MTVLERPRLIKAKHAETAPPKTREDSRAEMSYFFDISGLMEYVERNDRYSGIQRVMAVLISEFSRLVREDQIYLTWQDKLTGKLKAVAFNDLGEDTFTSPATMRWRFFPSQSQRDNLPTLRRYRRKAAKYIFHKIRLDIASILGKNKPFRRYGIDARKWREERKAARYVAPPKLNKVDILDVAKAGDAYVLLDLNGFTGGEAAVEKLKERGVLFFTMIHDLIPLVRPFLCPDYSALNFYGFLRDTMTYTDVFLSNSESSKRDLANFFAAHECASPIAAVPLAQERLPMWGKAGGDPVVSFAESLDPQLTQNYSAVVDAVLAREELKTIMPHKYVLCVGTLEARKNIWRIFRVWQHLLDTGHSELPKLVFAGRPGVMHDDFDAALEATGHLTGHVHVCDAPSDAELDVLYRNCEFTIMASLYEGWGLPVGESLAYGKTAVVSDNSSLPEVGGDLVEYCNAESIGSIAKAVVRLCDDDYRGNLEARIANSELRNWKDVARDLHDALIAQEPAMPRISRLRNSVSVP